MFPFIQTFDCALHCYIVTQYNMEFTQTERGARKLVRNGYQYVKQKDLANGLTSWECVDRRKGSCKAKLKLDPLDNFVEEINEHTHVPSAINCELSKVRANIKRKASTTQETAQQILGTELTYITDAAAVNLPSVTNLRRNIRHQRRQQNILPNPLRREDVPVIPQQYQLTATGERFLLFDSGVGDANRMLIFATDDGLQMLANSPQWFSDGTFKLCPEIFFQIYTLHALSNNEVLPCVFALLPSKTEATYTNFLMTILNAVRRINNNDPHGFLVDFELAAINSIRHLLPGSQVSGCFFHLCSNLWKHIQSGGMQEQYIADQQFALYLRMVAALAFVPPQDVENSFVQVDRLIRNQYPGDADEFLDYFEDTYIGRYRQNAARRAPMFAIELWNMFNRTDEELPRTNNSIEGWHSGFQAHVSCTHPTFWKFLDVLKSEERIVRVRSLQNQGGHAPPPQRCRYTDCNARILAIVNNYPNRQRLDYLRHIAYNLSL